MEFDRARDIVKNVYTSVDRVVAGKDVEIKLTVATVFAGGHVLLEGPPGVAKTFIAKALAKAIGGEFRRVQGNPDILPSDLTGFYIYRVDGTKTFVKGPVFTNILFFDELSRTPPRVQSALLEAMAEEQVSIEGETHKLPKPFIVIATIVSGGEVGVYPLTLTLLDRFWVKIFLGYSSYEEELEIVGRADELYRYDLSAVETVAKPSDVVEIQSYIDRGVHLSERVQRYIVDIVTSLRKHRYVSLGPSSRASIHLSRISKVVALMDGRDYVVPDDVKFIAPYVIAPKIVLRREAEVDGVRAEDAVREILNTVSVPKE